MQENQVVSFLRKRDYRFVRELGQGACGKTILLRDDQIDEYFVCKKYLPYSESQRESLFTNFVREIKLLHQIHHPNVVRVFNYYLYPELFNWIYPDGICRRL
jgi:serine/threonine-protein kinase